MEELERLQQLKEEAMKTIDKSVKKKPCKTCKKKKEEVKELPSFQLIETISPFTDNDLIEVYHLMNGSIKGTDLEKVKAVYKYIFNEDMDLGCGACGQKYFNKYKYHIKNVLKLDIR